MNHQKIYRKYKNKYLNLKNQYASTTIGLYTKKNKNYATIMTNNGRLVSFTQNNSSILTPENITKNAFKPSLNKILVIDSVYQFDIFTNKYGSVKLNGLFNRGQDESQIFINWDRVAMDYSGFFLDSNNDLRLARYSTAVYGASRLASWWKYEYKYYDVLIFDKYII